MGCCLSCLNQPQTGPTSRTPLISDNAEKNTVQSARTFSPPKKDEFETSVDVLAPAAMNSTSLEALDKTFKDQAKIYDDLLENFQNLKEKLETFKSFFVDESTNGKQGMTKCVTILVERCGDATLDLKRKSKNSIELQFRSEEVLRKCVVKYELALDPLNLFNEIAKHMQKILDRSPQVKTSIGILLGNTHDMKKDIMKADLTASQGPNAMKACIANISKLEKLSKDVDTIQKHTTNFFNDVLNASKGFFKEEDKQ